MVLFTGYLSFVHAHDKVFALRRGKLPIRGRNPAQREIFGYERRLVGAFHYRSPAPSTTGFHRTCRSMAEAYPGPLSPVGVSACEAERGARGWAGTWFPIL